MESSFLSEKVQTFLRSFANDLVFLLDMLDLGQINNLA